MWLYCKKHQGLVFTICRSDIRTRYCKKFVEFAGKKIVARMPESSDSFIIFVHEGDTLMGEVD